MSDQLFAEVSVQKSRNVVKQLLITLRNNPEERRSHLHRDGSRKSRWYFYLNITITLDLLLLEDTEVCT